MLNIHALFHQLVEEILSYSSLWPIQYHYRTGTGKYLLVVGVPWWSSSEDSTVLLQRAQVWSQIREDSAPPPPKKIPADYLLLKIFIFIYGCAGSSLAMHRLFSSGDERGATLQSQCASLSMRWLLLLSVEKHGFYAHGLQQLWLGSCCTQA